LEGHVQQDNSPTGQSGLLHVFQERAGSTAGNNKIDRHLNYAPKTISEFISTILFVAFLKTGQPSDCHDFVLIAVSSDQRTSV
jgi:hypothetical protein